MEGKNAFCADAATGVFLFQINVALLFLCFYVRIAQAMQIHVYIHWSSLVGSVSVHVKVNLTTRHEPLLPRLQSDTHTTGSVEASPRTYQLFTFRL